MPRKKKQATLCHQSSYICSARALGGMVLGESTALKSCCQHEVMKESKSLRHKYLVLKDA